MNIVHRELRRKPYTTSMNQRDLWSASSSQRATLKKLKASSAATAKSFVLHFRKANLTTLNKNSRGARRLVSLQDYNSSQTTRLTLKPSRSNSGRNSKKRKRQRGREISNGWRKSKRKRTSLQTVKHRQWRQSVIRPRQWRQSVRSPRQFM